MREEREGCFPRNKWASHPNPSVHTARINIPLPTGSSGPSLLLSLGWRPCPGTSPCPLDEGKQTQELTSLAHGKHAGHRGCGRTGAGWGSATIGDGATELRPGAQHWGVEEAEAFSSPFSRTHQQAVQRTERQSRRQVSWPQCLVAWKTPSQEPSIRKNLKGHCADPDTF